MRSNLVFDAFLKDAIVRRRLFLHGGGWLWNQSLTWKMGLLLTPAN